MERFWRHACRRYLWLDDQSTFHKESGLFLDGEIRWRNSINTHLVLFILFYQHNISFLSLSLLSSPPPPQNERREHFVIWWLVHKKEKELTMTYMPGRFSFTSSGIWLCFQAEALGFQSQLCRCVCLCDLPSNCDCCLQHMDLLQQAGHFWLCSCVFSHDILRPMIAI